MTSFVHWLQHDTAGLLTLAAVGHCLSWILISRSIAVLSVAMVGLPYAVLGAPAIVGISIGFEVVEIGHAVDGQRVKEAADRALYAAKAAGKGQAVFARAA